MKQYRRLRKKSNFCVALHPSSLQCTISAPHSSGIARLEFGTASAPPPSPGTKAAVPPPPSPVGTPGVDDSEGSQNAFLLIRAMIAAANADEIIDEDERNRILGKLETMDLSDQEPFFIVEELLSPAEMESIVTKVKLLEMAKQVYTVSLLAIEVDTDAERTYMNTLVRGRLEC
jgi:uncharacterized membrane protein YebE (DUF533 family)